MSVLFSDMNFSCVRGRACECVYASRNSVDQIGRQVLPHAFRHGAQMVRSVYMNILENHFMPIWPPGMADDANHNIDTICFREHESH